MSNGIPALIGHTTRQDYSTPRREDAEKCNFLHLPFSLLARRLWASALKSLSTGYGACATLRRLADNGDMSRITELEVNGISRRVNASPERSLLSVLRDDLDLTGAKYGCGEGQCGACTVLLDGEAVRSCITPVSQAARKRITTIEGLERDGRLHPLQEAFLETGAMQCGYCTPGMIMSGVSLLGRKANPSDAEIVHGMQGNICRCGTYPRIVAAVRMAAVHAKSTRRPS
jgi:aerobic-type carbon monoxide dehydrogenase small subunit (CoxS/CutS family)